jgi:hypothetical protein
MSRGCSPDQNGSVPLADALRSIAFLAGRWSGRGEGSYPTITAFDYEQEVTVTSDGRPFLQSVSRAWLLDGSGARLRPGPTELAFWRPAGEHGVELVLVVPTGIAEVYAGTVADGRIELLTVATARTPTAKEVTAGRRTYAVEGSTLVVEHDLEAVGRPLTRHLRARLERLPG